MKRVDFRITNCGSLFLLRPASRRAEEWIDENIVGDDEQLWFGGALVVERRFAGSLVAALVNEGFSIGSSIALR